jgi:lycopene cyclase domain-containing protein
MNLYTLLNFAVISVPVAFSFDKKVAYYRRWPAVFLSVITVGVPFILWDIEASMRGDWSFSEQYAGAFRVAALPIGEILFFIFVPFSCLFLFEVMGAYIKDKRVNIPKVVGLAAAVAALIVALIFRANHYTLRVFIAFALFLLLVSFTNLLQRRQFWLYMGISMVAFLVVNTILTALPIVEYNPDAIFGIRVITIPLEDFFYNFALLGFNALVFMLLRERVGHHE